MALCQLDGKIYDKDMVMNLIVLKNKNKELECFCCSQCWGIYNIKYLLGENPNIFIIPDDVVIKIYKISSTNFEYKPEKDKSESKVLIDILKIAKKKYKDLLRE